MRQCSRCGGGGDGGGSSPENIAGFTHNLFHRGQYRSLCTACLLKTHPGYFCPICFDVYDFENPPPSHERVMCLACSSISHLSCVDPPYTCASPTYKCPPCSNPNFFFFQIPRKKIKISSYGNGDGGGGDLVENAVFSEDLAKQFLAAVKISVASMCKAAAIAKANAERRAKEAVLAKKKAKQAIEQFLVICLESENEISGKD